MKQDAYTLHKPICCHFRRNRVMVGGIDQQYAIYTTIQQWLSLFVGVHRGVFQICLGGSVKKHPWSCIGQSVSNYIGFWMQTEKIMTDQGTEFLNRHFKALMKEDIELYSTYNETKASIVERLIGMLI